MPDEPKKREPNKGSMTKGDPRNKQNRERYLAEGGVERLRIEYLTRDLPLPPELAPTPAPFVASSCSNHTAPIDHTPPADPADELAAMEWVLTNGTLPRTPLERAYTDWLAKDPAKFMAEKRRLEGDPSGAPPGAPDPPKPEEKCQVCGREGYLEDAGSDRVEAMIEELLAKAGEEAQAATKVQKAWRKLPEEQRAAIMAMVDDA